MRHKIYRKNELVKAIISNMGETYSRVKVHAMFPRDSEARTIPVKERLFATDTMYLEEDLNELVNKFPDENWWYYFNVFQTPREDYIRVTISGGVAY